MSEVPLHNLSEEEEKLKHVVLRRSQRKRTQEQANLEHDSRVLKRLQIKHLNYLQTLRKPPDWREILMRRDHLWVLSQHEKTQLAAKGYEFVHKLTNILPLTNLHMKPEHVSAFSPLVFDTQIASPIFSVDPYPYHQDEVEILQNELFDLWKQKFPVVFTTIYDIVDFVSFELTNKPINRQKFSIKPMLKCEYLAIALLQIFGSLTTCQTMLALLKHIQQKSFNFFTKHESFRTYKWKSSQLLWASVYLFSRYPISQSTFGSLYLHADHIQVNQFDSSQFCFLSHHRSNIWSTSQNARAPLSPASLPIWNVGLVRYVVRNWNRWESEIQWQLNCFFKAFVTQDNCAAHRFTQNKLYDKHLMNLIGSFLTPGKTLDQFFFGAWE